MCYSVWILCWCSLQSGPVSVEGHLSMASARVYRQVHGIQKVLQFVNGLSELLPVAHYFDNLGGLSSGCLISILSPSLRGIM